MKKKQIIILGGGQTAAYAAKQIRSVDISSDITIITDEKYLPYERPPLSKNYIINKVSFNDLLFFSEDFYNQNNIDIITNTSITEVDFDNKKIFSLNKYFKYDKLLIATGSSNRYLKIFDKTILPDNNIIYLRNYDESNNLKQRIDKANNVVIIGGGFIGLEIASSICQKGKKVTILEKGSQLMGRVVPKEIAEIIQKKHESVGTKVYLNVNIEDIKFENNLNEIYFNNDQKLSADLIVVGIGSIPNITIFENTSLKIDNGIVTDEFSRTSIRDVYAAGDVSNFYHPFYDKYMRLESYQHAQNHGINAGNNMIGQEISYKHIPWMWSDQFNLNLQLTGFCNDYDIKAQRGLTLDEGIVYFFLKNDKIMGACGVGLSGKIGKDIRLAGKISEKKITITKEFISDKNNKLNKI